MRTILMAVLTAAGIGLAGTSGSSATPVRGPTIADAVKRADLVDKVHCVPGWRHHRIRDWRHRWVWWDGCRRYRRPYTLYYWYWDPWYPYPYWGWGDHWRWGSRGHFRGIRPGFRHVRPGFRGGVRHGFRGGVGPGFRGGMRGGFRGGTRGGFRGGRR